MRPGNRETIPTVAKVVRDAAALCDPDGEEPAITALVASFSDDDRPATAAEDLAEELLDTVRGIDPEGDDPAAAAAAAAAAWLATNPEQVENREHVLREGTRLVFAGDPPAPVSEWLAARGIDY